MKMPDGSGNNSESILPAIGPSSFQSTMWSVVARAAVAGPARDIAIETLCKAYWPPLYHFLRRKGHRHEDASDMVQEFIGILLASGALGRADAARGSFRTFLLMNLTSYVSRRQEKAHALKRGGGQAIVSLDELDDEGRSVVEEPVDVRTPEAEFHEQWARTILIRALAKAREETGSEFFDRLEPCLFKDEDAPGLQTLSEQTGRAIGTLKSDLFRLRERLRELIRKEIRETVQSESDYLDEIEQFKVLWSVR